MTNNMVKLFCLIRMEKKLTRMQKYPIAFISLNLLLMKILLNFIFYSTNYITHV